MPQQSLESSPANAMVSGSFKMSCANLMRFTYCWWRKLSFVMFDRNIFLYKNLFTWWGLIVLRPEVAESCEDICQLRAYPIYNHTLCWFFTSIWTIEQKIHLVRAIHTIPWVLVWIFINGPNDTNT